MTFMDFQKDPNMSNWRLFAEFMEIGINWIENNKGPEGVLIMAS